MKQVRAFAPANISLFFSVYDHKNPRWKGSYGCGFTLEEGVTVTVSRAKKNSIVFNGKKTVFPTVENVLKKLTTEQIKITIASMLPLGSGFGISGASTLASAYAVNSLLSLGFTKKRLGIFSHTAEVENSTGLGDVVNQYFGGIFIKNRPSSKFVVKRLPIKPTLVYIKIFGIKSTEAVLGNSEILKKISHYGNASINAIEKKNDVTLSDIFLEGKIFAEKSGLLKKKMIKDCIEAIEKKGGSATMVMIGNTIISTIPFPGSLTLHTGKTAAFVH